jgi:hypothetical protein
MRITILYRVCLDFLSLRHDGCDLFRQAFAEVKMVVVEGWLSNCQLLHTLMRREAAAKVHW